MGEGGPHPYLAVRVVGVVRVVGEPSTPATTRPAGARCAQREKLHDHALPTQTGEELHDHRGGAGARGRGGEGGEGAGGDVRMTEVQTGNARRVR